MKFLAEDDALTITFEGSEMLLAAKRKLVLPKKDIASLEWTAEFRDPDRVIRLVGAGIPGILYAGRFRDLKSGQNLFLYLSRPKGLDVVNGIGGENVLIVTMNHYRYHQIIVNCRPDIGKPLIGWWRG